MRRGFAFENFNYKLHLLSSPLAKKLFVVTGQVEEGQANEAQDDESVASTLPDDLSDDMTEVPHPCCPIFVWFQTIHPKSNRSSLAGCA